MFIELIEGDFINTAHIVRLSARDLLTGNTKRHAVEIDLADGSRVSGHIASHPDTLGGQVVPAAPDFVALKYWPGHASESDSVDKQPVLAWRVRFDGSLVAAVGFGDVHSIGEDFLCPDGVARSVYEEWWSDFDAWLKEQRIRHTGKSAA